MNNLNLHRVTKVEVSETTCHIQEPSEHVDEGSYSHRTVKITSDGFLFTIHLFTSTLYDDDGLTTELLKIHSTKEK